MVRGGFGIFYDAFPAVLGDNFMTNVPTVSLPSSDSGSGGVLGPIRPPRLVPGHRLNHCAASSVTDSQRRFLHLAVTANPLFFPGFL